MRLNYAVWLIMRHFRTSPYGAMQHSIRPAVLNLLFAGYIAIMLAFPGESAAQGGSPSPPSQTRSAAQNPESANNGAWRLVRTLGPAETGDVVSIMRTAEALDSDADLAGMIIRCRSRAPLQIAFVMVTPFPPKAHPRITVTVNGATTSFQSSVIPPGSMLSLPDEAGGLAQSLWQSARNLSVVIENDGSQIKGSVTLSGLAQAMGDLQSSCLAR